MSRMMLLTTTMIWQMLWSTAVLCDGNINLFCDTGLNSSVLDGTVLAFALWDEEYGEARSQWGIQTDPLHFSPNLIVLPESDDDIVAAVHFAEQCDYKISIRSGGHQYNGLSSCSYADYSCIQINMKTANFSQFSVTPNDADFEEEFEYVVRSGPGNPLAFFYEQLAENGLFIPGGMCTTVHVGGHAQSSGHGYIERGYGTIIDYALGFTIILSDGTIHDIVRPDTLKHKRLKQGGLLDANNDDLYFAVLGGGPGSFGIVTEYAFFANKDVDHPNAFVWQCIWQYNEDTMRSMLYRIEEFFGRLTPEDQRYDYSMELLIGQTSSELGSYLSYLAQLRDDLISAAGTSFDVSNLDEIIEQIWTEQGVNITELEIDWELVAEVLASNSNDTDDSDDAQAFFLFEAIYNDRYNIEVPVFNNSITDIIYNVSKESEYPLICFPRKMALSDMLFYLAKTANDEPQNRITQFSNEYLSKGFYDLFIERNDVFLGSGEVGGEYDILYGTQMYWSDTNVTNPYVYADVNRHRKKQFMSQILFYQRDHLDTELFVNQWQQQTMDMYLSPNSTVRFGDGSDIRSLAFTHGDVHISNSWQYYYFNKEDMERLVKIKKRVDAQDLFHTTFTIPTTTEGLNGF